MTMQEKRDMDYGIWGAMDDEEKAEWKKHHPDPLRAQFYINAKDIPKTNTMLYEGYGGSATDNDGNMLEYLNETSRNKSGIAKLTMDMNNWEFCEVEFNNGERYKCSYHRIGDGYILGEKLDLIYLNPKRIEKECPICGQTFVAQRNTKEVCSDRCRQRKKRTLDKIKEKEE